MASSLWVGPFFAVAAAIAQWAQWAHLHTGPWAHRVRLDGGGAIMATFFHKTHLSALAKNALCAQAQILERPVHSRYF